MQRAIETTIAPDCDLRIVYQRTEGETEILSTELLFTDCEGWRLLAMMALRSAYEQDRFAEIIEQAIQDDIRGEEDRAADEAYLAANG